MPEYDARIEVIDEVVRPLQVSERTAEIHFQAAELVTTMMIIIIF